NKWHSRLMELSTARRWKLKRERSKEKKAVDLWKTQLSLPQIHTTNYNKSCFIFYKILSKQRGELYTTDVQIAGYGKVGEYVPFYFTPRSIMLYNIVTGHRAPKVPKVPRENILVIRCLIEQLAKCGRYFFTDGQANVSNGTNHFHDLKDLDKIDWSIIQTSSFSKSTDDLDRARRYQAEFLVHDHVPVSAVESIVVYNKFAQARVEAQLKELQKELSVQIIRNYFF